MSLIDNIRSENGIDAVVGYEPLFLSVVKKKGFFLMSKETFDLEEMSCVRKTGKKFLDWLKENKLKIVEANIKDHFKIYY